MCHAYCADAAVAGVLVQWAIAMSFMGSACVLGEVVPKKAPKIGMTGSAFKVVLYVYAGVKLVPYCISSAIAIIPWSILFCYFGSLARNITEILEGKAGPSGKQSMLLLAVSGVVLVFVVVYSTIIAR